MKPQLGKKCMILLKAGILGAVKCYCGKSFVLENCKDFARIDVLSGCESLPWKMKRLMRDLNPRAGSIYS